MDDLRTWLKLAAAIAAAIWATVPAIGQALVILMAADIITGFLAAYITRSLSTSVSLRGLARKLAVLVVVVVSGALEPQVGFPAAQAAAGFYCLHEGLSIVENLDRAGLPVPRALRDALAKLSQSSDGGGGSDGGDKTRVRPT